MVIREFTRGYDRSKKSVGIPVGTSEKTWRNRKDPENETPIHGMGQILDPPNLPPNGEIESRSFPLITCCLG